MQEIEPESFQGPAEWFAGDVHATILLAGADPSRVRVASIHFAPGARTAWHSHGVGQYLHTVEGTALVQERGGEPVTLLPGTTVYTPPAVEHWHGAAADSSTIQLAIWEAPSDGGQETTWGAHVADAG